MSASRRRPTWLFQPGIAPLHQPAAMCNSVCRPALRPLPAEDYEYAEWRLARVNLDDHVEAEGFLYSVPHALIREQVDVRVTSHTVEVFHRRQRVAAHQRRFGG